MAEQPSENPTFKLTYFNLRGLAEPIRMLLAYGGIEYEDVRIEREDWPALKPSTPFGQMPLLDVDGIRVHQSLAIVRYIAKRVGLAGSNDWESLLIDVVGDTANDMRLKIVTIVREPDETIKATKMEELKNETIPFFMEKFDAMAVENNGYLALNGQLSWADIYFSALVDVLGFFLGENFVENYANLQTVVNNVTSVDSIKAWIESRPTTEF